MERRNKVLMLIAEGRNETDISKILEVSLDTVYKDKKAMLKKALSYIETLGSRALAYLYEDMIEETNRVKREMWSILKNKESLPMDKIHSAKVVIQIITEKRELIKESVSFAVIEELKKRIEQLESNEDNKTNYFNQSLPELKDSMTIQP